MIFFTVCSAWLTSQNSNIRLNILRDDGLIKRKFDISENCCLALHIKHANNTSLTKGYTNALEKYRHLDNEKHVFLVMNFEENHAAQLKAIRVIENPICRIFEIDVTKREQLPEQDFDEDVIEFENLEFEDDRYVAEKRKGGLNSYQRNQPLRTQVQALCKEELAKGNYPSALQLCQKVANRMVDEYPELLSSFELYQNHHRTGQDWTKPTFYEWCNREHKSFKSKCKIVAAELLQKT